MTQRIGVLASALAVLLVGLVGAGGCAHPGRYGPPRPGFVDYDDGPWRHESRYRDRPYRYDGRDRYDRYDRWDDHRDYHRDLQRDHRDYHHDRFHDRWDDRW
jgi:hypothetical protein